MDNKTLSHEIINLLNVIVGYAELTKLENLPENVNNNINAIITQSMNCYHLLDDELNDKNNGVVNLKDFLNELINEIETLPLNYDNNYINYNSEVYESSSDSNDDASYKNELVRKQKKHIKKKHNIIFTILANDNLVDFKVKVHKTYLKVTIQNLLMNSIKYSVQNKPIIIKLGKIDKYIYITISNNTIKNTNMNAFSNNYGLSVVDDLVEKMSCRWILNQDNGIVTNRLFIPIR